MSGRVVKTRIGSAPVGKSMCAPVDRPIQFRCCSLIGSGQSSVSRSAISRSPYAVIRIIHCFRLRLKTGKLPRSDRPSGVTSSLASTVPSPGHQLTGAWETYASRWSSTIRRRSTSDSSAQSRPSGVLRVPAANSAIRSATGRALAAVSSYQEL